MQMDGIMCLVVGLESSFAVQKAKSKQLILEQIKINEMALLIETITVNALVPKSYLNNKSVCVNSNFYL